MDIRVVLGGNVRRLRKAAGLTQEQLSARCDFDQRYISQLEQGQRNPTVLSLHEIAVALGTTAVVLITPTEDAADQG